MLRSNGLNYKNNSLRSTSTGKRSLNRIYNTILIYQKSCWMCINIDIVLHHATIKRYFDSFLTCQATLGCVGQKCVRPPIFFDRYAYDCIWHLETSLSKWSWHLLKGAVSHFTHILFPYFLTILRISFRFRLIKTHKLHYFHLLLYSRDN